jgi:hypothetical protein
MGDSPGRGTLRRDDRGVSETLGVVLLVALTVIGTTLTVALGGAAIEDARDTTETESAQHAMTLFDARSALVALGDAGVQTVDLGRARGGAFDVREGEGWLRITHQNYSGTDDEEIYNGTLGSFVYETEDTTLAYQGGGVWRVDGNGSARMVSPPEFHYRGATLTLPVIRVEGSAAGSGASRAVVRQSQTRSRVFPNASNTYDGGSRRYANPTSSGTMMVTVHSEYYRGWASYFRARTEGNVSVDHANETVSAELVAVGTLGAFDMPSDGNSIDVRGLQGGHSVNDFTITLKPDDADSAEFSNLQWSMYAASGSKEFEVHLRKSGTDDVAGTPCTEVSVQATVYYSDGGSSYQGWTNDTAFRTECYDADGDGTNDETQLTANLTGDTKLSMQDLSNSDLQYFSPSGETRQSPVTFDEHSGTVAWEAKTFQDGGDDDTTIGNLTGHYMSSLGSSYELEIDDKNSDSVNEDQSHGNLDYGGTGRVVTFLHVTENRVEVDVE